MGNHHRYCAPAISRTLALVMAGVTIALAQLSHTLIAATSDTGAFPMTLTSWLTLAPDITPASSMNIITVLLAMAIIALTIWLFKARNRMRIGPIGLLLGGVAANMLERIQTATANGFIDLHRGANHLPLLSVGDIFALIGISILLLSSFAPSKYAYCDVAQK